MWNVLRKAAFAVGVLAALPAHALSLATVNIGQPIISVEDLDAADGIDASFRLGGSMVFDFVYELGTVRFEHRVLEGDADVLEGPLDLSGVARESGGRFLGIAERWVPGYTLTATPNTRVTVEVPYELAATVDPASAIPPDSAGHASLELGVLAIENVMLDPSTGFVTDYNLFFREFRTVSLDVGAGPSLRMLQGGPSQGVLGLSFENRSAGESVFSLRAVMTVHGLSVAPTPMPEPSQWALALGGLAFVVAMARRRGVRAVSSRS